MDGLVDDKRAREGEGREEGNVRTGGKKGKSIGVFSLPLSLLLRTYLSFAPPPELATLGPPPPPPRLGAGAAVGKVVLMPLVLPLRRLMSGCGSGRREGLSCRVLLLEVAAVQMLLLLNVVGVVGRRAARRRTYTRGSILDWTGSDDDEGGGGGAVRCLCFQEQAERSPEPPAVDGE